MTLGLSIHSPMFTPIAVVYSERQNGLLCSICNANSSTTGVTRGSSKQPHLTPSSTATVKSTVMPRRRRRKKNSFAPAPYGVASMTESTNNCVCLYMRVHQHTLLVLNIIAMPYDVCCGVSFNNASA